MVGEVFQVRKDDKRWRREGISMATPARYHLRDWKVIIWWVVCLMSLVHAGRVTEDMQEPGTAAALRTSAGRTQHVPYYPQLSQQEGESDSSWTGLPEDPMLLEEGEWYQRRWQRSAPEESNPKKSRKNRKKNRNSQDCRMERKQIRVRDLGLGYDSDEIVVFKYCVGTCMSSRKNYDLALKFLTANGSIEGRKVSTNPCCRPTRFEAITFMDTQAEWKTVKWLSAANCSCVG